MKRHLPALCTAGLLSYALLTSAWAKDAFLPFPIEQTVLKNGLTVIVVPIRGNGLVAYRTIMRTGSRDEYEVGRTGFAHFFEHMMFRGTKKYPEEVYRKQMIEMGVDANAYTDNDITVYHLNASSEDLEKVMELESDRFQNLDYPKQGFQTEAGAVYGEYRKSRTNPFFSILEALSKTAFIAHSYGHTPMGYEADIQGMPNLFAYSKQFFKRYYRPENAILLVVGDVDAQNLFALAEKYYGNWRRGYVAPQVKPEPPQTQARRVEVAYPGQTLPILWVAYKADAFDPANREYAALYVLAELAFGETSDLYQRLVLRDQLVESMQGQAPNARDLDLFSIVCEVKKVDQLPTVEAAILAAIEESRKAPPDRRRVEEVKSHLRYGFLMGLASPEEIGDRIGRLVGVVGGTAQIERFYRTIAEVTPEDVLKAANRYLSAKQRTIATLKGVNK
jgi:zinc protease